MASTVGSAHARGASLASRDEAWASEAVASPETTRQAQMGKVFGYLKGLHATHLMDVGAKLGLFERLAANPDGLPPDRLAAETGLHPPSARVWCEAACALELLDYDPATGYRLAPFMDELLGQPGATYYLGRFPETHLQVARDYARYPELFRSGEVFPYQAHDGAFFASVAEGLQTLPRMFLDAVVPKLPDLAARLEGGAAILDVGCGGGYAIVEFAERFPGVRCVGIDVEPNSVGLARELIRARGLEDRVEARLVEGASWPADLDGAFDLVTTFLVLHEIRPDLKEAVIGRCARALRPGGQVLIFDERYPSRPGELRDAAQVYAVMAQWYEVTWGNIINTREEIHALLTGQGLGIVDETSLSRFYIVTAEKPATA
jgi:cyclopropane fatty-acyl-phospholipid synthase-like methyltransferase